MTDLLETDGVWHLFAATPHEYGLPAIDTETITETDIPDSERDGIYLPVNCVECGKNDAAVFMDPIGDDEYLCPPCSFMLATTH